MTNKNIHVEIDMTAPEAQALAQFVKRVGWSELRSCAVDDDEASTIRDAIYLLQDALSKAGFSQR